MNARKSDSLTCIIIHPVFRQKIAGRERNFERTLENEIEEAEGLARAIDLEVMETRVTKVQVIAPGYLLGEGTRRDLEHIIAEIEPTVVIVNFNLSPVQQRNLEKI